MEAGRLQKESDHPGFQLVITGRTDVFLCLISALLLASFSATTATADVSAVFSDGFESGNFNSWTNVVAQSGGTAVVQSTDARTGVYSAHLSSSAATGSVAYARKTFSASHQDLAAAGNFKITAEGAANSNVPILQFFDAAGNRVVSFYRQNQDYDKLWVQHSGGYHLTSGRLALNSWAQLQLHAITNGTEASTVEAHLNGALVYATNTASLGSGGVATIQIGNDTAAQAFALVADDIAVNTSTGDPTGAPDTTPPDTTIDTGPSGSVSSSSASFTFTSTETGSSFQCSLDEAPFSSCSSPMQYSSLVPGPHSFRARAIDQAGNVDPTPAERSWTVTSNGPKLLIADLRNRRLLITDFDGRLIWKFDNPTGRDHPDSGPLGVRWMPGNQILATFGTGEVGLIDVATKTWVWKTTGYGGDWFQSPYDAEILPDGNLAVAMRYNEGGRISVYDPSTGRVVWKHLLSNAHSVKFRTAEQSYRTNDPTLLVGGWGSVREVAYRPKGGHKVTWNVRTEFTHDALVVENDRVLTTEGYYIQKINREGGQIWRHSTPEENRRIAVNPSGGYIYTVAEADKVEFRDTAGLILRQWSAVSDGSNLDYPYGLQVINFPG